MVKILCTISPMSKKLTGMDMARINGSFGTKREIRELVKSVNVPVILDIPRGRTKPKTTNLTDKELIKFAIEENLAYIGVSYVKSAKDIFEVRNIASPASVKLISKIETKEAIKNIDQIISASDGIMIDRGDLANEIGIEKLPKIQKRIIHKCNLSEKPVIVATEMLLSMVENSKPTKAEVLDIANAVSDGADYVMLSEETAIGKYPNQAIELVKKIIKEIEADYKVVVLAAGSAARLGSLTAEKPTCLIDIGGESILEHQINNLKEAGIEEEDIIIATGKGEEKIREIIKSRDIQYIYNPWYESTNMLTTLWLAQEIIKKGCIIIYGDIIFDKRILMNLLKIDEDIVLCVEKKKSDEEAEKVCVKNDLMTLSKDYKKLPFPKHKCIPVEEAYGEFIGMAKFSRLGSILLINEMEKIVKNRNFNAFLVYAFEQLVKKGVKINIYNIGDLKWNDNDTLEDLRITREFIYPDIKLNEDK